MTTAADHAPAGPPPHTPEAGWDRVKQTLGDRVPAITDADREQIDDLIARAHQITADRRYAA